MDIYDNTNVLDEVESLFNKLESSPESTKHGDFSKIQEKTLNRVTSENAFSSAKEQNHKTGAGKKKKDFSSVNSEIRDKEGLNFIDVVTRRNRSLKRIDSSSWEDDERIQDTLETLHEMLFSEENDKLLEDSYPWNDHAYDNKSNWHTTNIAQNEEEDDRDWLFEGFPISSCPSNFHTYSNISSKLAGSKTNIDRKATRKFSSCLPVDPRKKPFVCVECKRAFPDVYYLNLHKKRHKGEKDYLCDQCPYMNYDMDELKRHIQRVHLKTKTILCEYCGNLFAAMVNLQEHLKRKHFHEKIFVCNQCSFKTYSHLTLKRHVLRVHQRQYYPHLCPVCDLKIEGKQNLLNHVKTHIKRKPFSCKTCGKFFAVKKRLCAHMKTVHQPRQFLCEVCNKLFQTKFHLDRHMTIHFKHRPFSCPFCLYASNTHGNLSKHVRSVHGKKDFSIKKFKSQQSTDHISIECIEKGKDVTVQYLNELSKQLNEDITIKSLQEQRLLYEMAREVELLKSKNLSRNLQAVDHSYSEKIDSGTGSNKVLIFKMYPIVSTDTELTLSLPNENETQVTVSKIDLERSLEAHHRRVQEVLYCNKSDTASNKSDQMLSGGDFLLLGT